MTVNISCFIGLRVWVNIYYIVFIQYVLYIQDLCIKSFKRLSHLLNFRVEKLGIKIFVLKIYY